jgi:hypothetical protein
VEFETPASRSLAEVLPQRRFHDLPKGGVLVGRPPLGLSEELVINLDRSPHAQ